MEVVAIDGHWVTAGGSVILPSGATVSVNSDYSVKYQPSVDTSITDSFTTTVADDTGGVLSTINTADEGVSVTINRPPVLASFSNQAPLPEPELVCDRPGHGPNLPSDTETFSLVNAPWWANINSSTGVISINPNLSVAAGPTLSKSWSPTPVF